MKRSFLLLCVASFAALFLSTRAFASDPSLTAKIQAAMAEFKSGTASLGAPRLDGNTLLIGTSRMNGNYTLVDALKEKHGCTATIFARRGENFIRIATNVIKEDGSRAVGTPLDPKGPAIAAIRENRAYYGEAEILGSRYETAYEPLRDETGQVIGILYVGYKIN
jgi:hypothetical protein